MSIIGYLIIASLAASGASHWVRSRIIPMTYMYGDPRIEKQARQHEIALNLARAGLALGGTALILAAWEVIQAISKGGA